MIVNVESNSVTNHNLNVTTLPYATVTIVKNDRVHTIIADESGVAVFKNLSSGTWIATATSEDGNLTNTVEVDIHGDVSIEIILNNVLDFTYSISAADGGYKVYDGNDIDITSNPVTQGDWKIKFLKTGELTIHKLNGANGGIDIFCVGGGGNGGSSSSESQGGGGGGGYTTTQRGVSVSTDTYNMYVGGSGGTTYAFKGTSIEVSASGGKNGTMYTGTNTGNGGDGGSGGGGLGCAGGSNGGDGGSAAGMVHGKGGKGQGNPPGTKEFNESSGDLYAGGGGGGAHAYTADYETGTSGGYNPGSGGAGGGGRGGGGLSATNAADGTANTGGGGGGQGTGWGRTYACGHGGSGIIIIRNIRS